MTIQPQSVVITICGSVLHLSLSVTRTISLSDLGTAPYNWFRFTIYENRGESTVQLSELKLISTFVPADVNGDGKVTNFDYGKVNQHVCKVSMLSEYEQQCADVNDDGKVTNFDAGKINQHVCKVKSLWS